MQKIRIGLDGIMLASALFGIPVVTGTCALLLSLRWRAWEVLAAGVFVDLLYVPMDGIFGVPFPATITALVVVWGLEPFRMQLYE